MAKRNGSKASRLSAEEGQLEQQRAEIMRRQQELEKKLKMLPAVLEAQEEQKRALTKRRAADAGPAISPYVGRNRGRRKNRTMRTPSSERMAAQIKTLALLCVLGVMGVLLYKAVPTKAEPKGAPAGQMSQP